ncbi:alpha/beta hydrolase [Aurantiacibacter xanthus]|uniref:Alpha/beta hydrolase n=1 Tax=Aurantiacibacter xanthus TaxID=1784712 RepID=A0A3A1P5R6_9SPHN|nr:alpha/beta hydrolase [Aurantiacibacter xanthus]
MPALCDRHADSPLLLTVPGLDNSGPAHWQTLWENEDDRCARVELGLWDRPSPLPWAGRLNAAVAMASRPVVLIAHSLGCHAVAWWSMFDDALTHKVAGALLVAPPEVDDMPIDERLRPFAPTARARLPFPSILAASRNDPYATFGRAKRMARIWGSRLVDAGALGHINADSRIGNWPYGRYLLDRLIAGITPSPRPLLPGGAVETLQQHEPATLALGR